MLRIHWKFTSQLSKTPAITCMKTEEALPDFPSTTKQTFVFFNEHKKIVEPFYFLLFEANNKVSFIQE